MSTTEAAIADRPSAATSPSSAVRPGPGGHSSVGSLLVVGLLVVGLLVVSLVATPSLAALLAALGVAVVAVPPRVPAALRVTSGFLALATLTMSGALVTGVLGATWSPWFVSVPVLVAGATSLLVRGPAAVARARTWRWTLTDTVSAVLAVTVTAPSLLSLARLPVLQAMGTLGTGLDNINHLSITRGVMLVGSYLHLNSDAATPYVLQGHVGYPQGAHLLVATAAQSGGAGSVLDLVPWFLGMSFLWYAALFVVCAALLTRAYETLARTPRRFGALLGLLALAVAFLAASPVELLTYGFVSETPALTFLGALILLAWTTGAGASSISRYAVMLALVVAIAGTWWYALPVAITVPAAWLYIHRGSLRGQWVRVLLWTVAAAAFAVILVGGLLVSVARLASQPGSVAELLNIPGLIGPTPWLGAALVAALAVGSLTWARSRRGRAAALSGGGSSGPEWPPLVATVAAIGFATLVAAYQILTEGGTSYYFTKAVHIVLLVAGPVAIAFLAALVTGATRSPDPEPTRDSSLSSSPGTSHASPGTSRRTGALTEAVVLAAGLAAVLTLSWTGPLASYADGKNALDTAPLAFALRTMPTGTPVAGATGDTAGDAAPFVFLDNPDGDDDLRLMTRLLAVTFDQHTSDLLAVLPPGEPSSAAEAIELHDRTGREVIVLTDDAQQLQTLRRELAGYPQIRVALIS